MQIDEAPSLSEPLKCKTKNKSTKVFGRITYFLFIIVIALVINNLIIYSWYNDTKRQIKDTFLRVRTISEEKSDLAVMNEDLKSDYTLLKKGYSEILNQNETIIKELNELKSKNKELEKTNKQLVDDNVELQNSLKKAASVGIKPQNYTKFSELSSRGEINRGEYVGKFFGTAYTPSKVECGNDKGITHSGKPIMPGVSIAVDRKYWPFGTVFYIKGLGYAVAMDTGSAIKGKNRFDFAVFDRNFAKKLGTDYWDVYLVKLGNGKVEDISL
jgi:3D (Asp-Asp-Asp) domain-containing protein